MLYNYAFAKKSGGQFIMRIEDTDQKRLVPGAVERLLAVVKDYGLDWDELYVQSQRLEIYKKHAQELLQKNAAYYCFCTEERLKALRDEQQKSGAKTTKYDRHCLNLSEEKIAHKLKAGEKHVIRLKVPTSQDISFDDLFLGKITVNSSELDDQVLLKSDGFPTYHLAVVVDDHLMGITHILRGIEWLPSTPKHILLYKAFGWEMPLHGHLPNLKEVGATKKLSKRVGDVSALSFLEAGFLPEALLNFLMFLGWNPGTEKELYSLTEFITDFSLDKVHTSDLVAFDREKLLWLNGVYIRNLSSNALWDRITAWAQKFNVDLKVAEFDQSYIVQVVGLVQERLETLQEFTELTGYFFENPNVDRDLLVAQTIDSTKSQQILCEFVDGLSVVEEKSWNRDTLDKLCHELLAKQGYKPKEAFMTLRVALTGVTATPPLFDVMAVLGKDLVLKRLNLLLS